MPPVFLSCGLNAPVLLRIHERRTPFPPRVYEEAHLNSSIFDTLSTLNLRTSSIYRGFHVFRELPPDISWGLIPSNDKLCPRGTDSLPDSHFFGALPHDLRKMAGLLGETWVSVSVLVMFLIPHVCHFSSCEQSTYIEKHTDVYSVEIEQT